MIGLPHASIEGSFALYLRRLVYYIQTRSKYNKIGHTLM